MTAYPNDVCCATITSKPAGGNATSSTQCYLRSLATQQPSVTVNNVTYTYACLTTTAPANSTVNSACTANSGCASSQCCQQRTLSQGSAFSTQPSSKYCVDSSKASASFEVKLVTPVTAAGLNVT